MSASSLRKRLEPQVLETVVKGCHLPTLMVLRAVYHDAAETAAV